MSFLFVLIDDAVAVPKQLVQIAVIVSARALQEFFVRLFNQELVTNQTAITPHANVLGPLSWDSWQTKQLVPEWFGQNVAGRSFENYVHTRHSVECFVF